MKKFLALAVLMGIAVLPAFAQQEIRSEGSLDFSKADLSGNLTVKIRHGADCDQTAGCGDQSVELGR